MYLEYLILVISCMLIAIQFSATKVYQRHCMRRKSDVMVYPIITSLISFAVFFVFGLITNEVQQEFLSAFGTVTFWVALIQAILSTVSVIVGVVIAKLGSTAIYSVFMMLGGMIFPSVYGFVVGDGVTLLKLIGIFVLIFAIIIPVLGKGQKMSVKFFLFCITAFALNGAFSTLSAFHAKQIEAGVAFGTTTLLLWHYALITVGSLVGYVIMRFFMPGDNGQGSLQNNAEDVVIVKKTKTPLLAKILASVVAMKILSSLMYSLSSGPAFFLQLTVLETVSPTIVTPLVSGLTIVMSAIAGYVFFKEKPDLKNLIAIGVVIVGVALIIVDGVVAIPL